MLERIALPGRQAVAWAVVMNACMIALVAPIILSPGWSLLAQGVFATGVVVLAVKQAGTERVKRPKIHVPGAWVASVAGIAGLSAALALAVYARLHDNPWLAAADLVVNFAGYLVAYGGLGFLLRRQYARLG